MKAITQAVLNNKADLGIIFDTDVDRFTFVLSERQTCMHVRLIS